MDSSSYSSSSVGSVVFYSVLGLLISISSMTYFDLFNNNQEREEEEEGDGVDRLSILSDDILHQIFYFAGSRKLVQLSILSKRWTRLWASTTLVNFDVMDFYSSSSSSSSSHRRPVRVSQTVAEYLDTKLIRFMKVFMFTRQKKLPISKLRLAKFGTSGTMLSERTLIGLFRLHLGLEEGQICSYQIGKPAAGALILGPEIHSMVRQLHTPQLHPYFLLQTVEFSGFSWTNSRFEMLEELFTAENMLISHCEFRSCKIQMSHLKVLRVRDCRSLDGLVQIDAPNLVSLELRRITSATVVQRITSSTVVHILNSLPVISDAFLDIDVVVTTAATASWIRNLDMLTQLCNVHFLTLSSSLFQCLNLRPDICSSVTFHNLKHVVVMFETFTQPLQLADSILLAWPNLESLEGKLKWY